MDYSNVISRRLLVRHGAGLVSIALLPKALALSPLPPTPPALNELVREAELIVVGTVERLIYRGSRLIERDQEFDSDDDGTHRFLEATLRIGRTIYGNPPPTNYVRVQRQVSKAEANKSMGVSEIFLLKRIHVKTSIEIPLYSTLNEPLPEEDQARVIQAIRGDGK